jgi:transposase
MKMARTQARPIILTEEERVELLAISCNTKRPAQDVRRANILLLADRSQGVKREDKEIADFLNVTVVTVCNTRNKFIEHRLKKILHKKGAGRPRKIDGEVEAHMIAVACSPAPEGQVRWTLQMIADKVVELTDLEELSAPSVYNTLKKMNSNHG